MVCGLASKSLGWFVSGLASKLLGRFLRFDLKIIGTVLRLGLKTGGDGFSGLASKPVAMVSWLSLKTKVVEGFSVWASKPTTMVW
jgi:hypothetical protein